MPVSTYALVSREELETYLNVAGSAQTANLEGAINRASSWLEGYTSREMITRGALTEFHTVRRGDRAIRVREWPIIAVTTVHESTDSPRAYDADSLLTADTDYQVVKERGRIVRLSLSEPIEWALGYRAIQAVYSAGYADTASVPDDLKLICLFVAAGIFKESDRSRWGLSSVTDSQGSITRFLGYLPPDMKSHLDLFKRVEFERTWKAS